MAQAKIIKIPNGDAFIEIGKDYVRIGAGDGTFMSFDKASINAGAKNVNWQLSPDKFSYFGILAPITPMAGVIPFTPPYFFSDVAINSFVNVAITTGIIAGVVGMIS